MKAYSLDLRERVVRAVDQGYKRRDSITLFGVSKATIKRDGKQRSETGHVKRKPLSGRPAKEGAPLQAGLIAQRNIHPDATREMPCQVWEQTPGVHVSTSPTSQASQRVSWIRKKKTLGATEHDEEARADFCRTPRQISSSIEGPFSKLKTHVRQVGARTREVLSEVIPQALRIVTAQDVQGWFRHGGSFSQAGR